jgi:hypothetical protein
VQVPEQSGTAERAAESLDHLVIEGTGELGAPEVGRAAAQRGVVRADAMASERRSQRDVGLP